MWFKCFELVIFQLQRLKIACKFVAIRLSYDRKKKGAFYETPCIA